MPDSSSALLGLRLQALGENLNTWGDPNLNNNFSRMEEAICGAVSIAVEANVSLTSTDYVQNQARYAMLIFTGSGGFNITCPATAKMYLVKNDCAAAVTFTHGSGDTIAVAAGAIKWVATDGTDFFTAEEQDYLLLTGGALSGNLTIGGTLGVTGATTLTGLASYDSDLSGSYTDRSLVDKAYIDALAFAAVDLPGQTGNAGKFLTTDGTNASWATLAVAWSNVSSTPTTLAGYGITDAQPLDSDLTAIAALTTNSFGRNALVWAESVVSGDVNPCAVFTEYLVDSSSAARSLTLPASPASGDRIRIGDRDGNAKTNNITVARNGKTIVGASEDLIINLNYATVELRYDGTSDWEIV